MTKIMLVEDDKSLREIYGVRLLAEGYDIVSAGDGEEALAMAIKERPQLIISDVMMPKISGFDMLDILRSTTETKDIKVIMMTALSSEEQRNRGQSLGADKYLVKSQVGIEDVVQVVHEVLGDNSPSAGGPSAPQSSAPASMAGGSAAPAPAPQPQQQPPAAPPAQQQRGFSFQSATPNPALSNIPRPTAPPANPVTAPKPAGSGSRVIQPISNAGAATVDIAELMDKELAKEAGVDEGQRPAVETVAQEKAAIETQINQFAAAPVPSEQPAASPSDDDLQHVNISPDGTFQPETPANQPQQQAPAAPQDNPAPSQPQQPAAPRFTPPAQQNPPAQQQQ